jgi:ribonuclease P protein component
MLPLNNRLRKNKDIDSVYKNGRLFSGNNLKIKIFKNQLATNRFTVVVSSKVSKKAVIRNKIKRYLREILRTENINFQSGNDLILTALPIATKTSSHNLKTELLELLQKSKLYK